MGAFLLTIKPRCLKQAKVSLDLRGSMIIDRPGFTVTAAALITVIDYDSEDWNPNENRVCLHPPASCVLLFTVFSMVESTV